MKNKFLTTALVLTVIAAGALVFTQAVQAGRGPTGQGWNEAGMGQRGAYGDPDMDAMAEALGISTEELQAAHEAVYAQAIDQALDAGLITATQAEALKSDEGFGRMRLAGLLSTEGAAEIDMQAMLIAELGITQEAYNAARGSVQQANLNAAVAAGRLTQAEADAMGAMRALRTSNNFATTMRTALRSGIEAALTEGVLTQAQADALQARVEARNGNGLFGGEGRGQCDPGMQQRGSGLGAGQGRP